ncbi:MAG TPA: type II toxin-antitoxin system RelE/ParE family toxin [Nitrospiraceae bacterium]|nr:type II toxin-antitoxin system RelE/ParE family toxin [Nitrospiraceae bacterium]
MAELTWSERSILDVEDIYDYIAHDSVLYAKYQAENIINAVERLRQFPESGRHIPEFPNLPHREVIMGSYRIIYRYDVNKNEVKVVTVIHGSRLLTATFFASE